MIVKTTQAAIAEMGLPARTDQQCASMIGLRLVEIPPVLFPECEVEIMASLSAGVTPERHETALAAMEACQITVVR